MFKFKEDGFGVRSCIKRLRNRVLCIVILPIIRLCEVENLAMSYYKLIGLSHLVVLQDGHATRYSGISKRLYGAAF